MWILPKQLHTLASAQDTEALISDLKEQSQVCAQSLLVKSKPSPLPIWLRKWKQDSWTLHLSGRILRPSHGQAFVDRWISSVAATRASHSQPQASNSEQKTHDIYGHSSLTASEPCNLEFAFSRTSKGISVLDSEKSLANWKASVTEQRGVYSARQKLAHHTDASGCSSWPSPVASEARQGFQDRSNGKKGSQESLTTVVILAGRPAPANPSTNGSRQESWVTPRTNGTSTRPNKTSPRQGLTLIEQARANQSGKLNPRWVETLMGLPVGWTMPSCMSPVTIEPTNCAYSATESCLPPQNSPSESCQKDYNETAQHVNVTANEVTDGNEPNETELS